jgi:hypothetical protein
VPTVLSDYQKQVQRLVGDIDQHDFNIADLTTYINLAREQVAAEGQCIRWLTPPANGIAAVTPVSVGSGYSMATVTIPPPDVPGVTATAIANIVGGEITSYTVTNPGNGYLYIPNVTVSGDGTGATAAADLLYTMQFLQGVELYNYSDIPVAQFKPGASSILAVLDIAVIWQNIRYTGNQLSFSQFQGLVRSYTSGNFLYTPFWFANYGQGDQGSLYVYPVPDQNYPAELDTLLLPAELVDDTSIELIPRPWTYAVPFYAAFLALLSTNDPARTQLAFRYFNETNGGLFNFYMRRARAFSQPRLVSSYYGRKLF